MRKYRFVIGFSDIEKMWDFAKNNQLNIHRINVKHSAENNEFKKDYLYEGYMDEETYTSFRLAVPLSTAK